MPEAGVTGARIRRIHPLPPEENALYHQQQEACDRVKGCTESDLL